MKRIIGYLMFLANGESVKEPWYSLKDILCKRFGSNDGYDIQYLSGIQCNYCNGTGIYKKYFSSNGRYGKEICMRCNAGWYRDPRYVLLERIKVGSMVFHKPIKSESKPFPIENTNIPASITIDGYIEHRRKKFGWLAFFLLFIIFSKRAYITYVRGMGVGWRCSWWLPRNYLYNLMHLIKNGRSSIPIKRLRDDFRSLFASIKGRRYSDTKHPF